MLKPFVYSKEGDGLGV